MRKTFVSLTLAVFSVCSRSCLFDALRARTAKAATAQQPDPCQKCLEKLARDFDKCEEKYGVSQRCYDQFKQ